MKFNIIMLMLVIGLFMLISPMAKAMELNPFAEKMIVEKTIKEDMSSFIKEDFNDKYGVIRLSDTFFWFETDKVAEYSLTSIKESIINIEMLGKASIYKDGTLFDDATFKGTKGIENLRSSNYYILVTKDNLVNIPIFKEVCVDVPDNKTGEKVKSCHDQIESYKSVNEPIQIWQKYEEEVLMVGDYAWKFVGERSINQKVDVVPVKNGNEFSVWVWYNTSWDYKKQVDITTAINNPSVATLSLLKPSTMDAEYKDLRFINNSESGELPYYIEWSNSTTLNVSVRIDNNASIFMYYGNALATANTSNYSLTKWNTLQNTNQTALSASADDPARKGIKYVANTNQYISRLSALGGAALFTINVSGNFVYQSRSWYNGTGLVIYNVNYPLLTGTNYIIEVNASLEYYSATAFVPPKLLSYGNVTERTFDGKIYNGFSISVVSIDTIPFINNNYAFGIEQSNTATDTLTVVNSRPANNSMINTASVTFGCNTTTTGTMNITSVTLNSSWTQSVTGLATPNYNASITNTTLPDGNYTWNCFSYGTDGINATSSPFYFYKDTLTPVITIAYPQSLNYSVNVSVLNYSIYHPLGVLSSCWYSTNLGATNTSISCGTNITGRTSAEGSNTWKVWANDSTNNVGVGSVTFFKDTIYPLIEYITPPTPNDTLLTNINSFTVQVNVTETNYPNINFNLYNSTGLVQNNQINKSSSSCYQETPNVSTSCGGLNGGNYVLESGYNISGIDGDWNTATHRPSGSVSYIYVNYSVPIHASSSSIWTVKYDSDNIPVTITNFTLGSCWNTNSLQFRLSAWDLNVNTNIECYNGTWNNLYYASTSGGGDIYEEAMIWDFNISTTFSGLLDNTYYYNVTALDIVGNSNSTTTRNITIDTTSPYFVLNNLNNLLNIILPFNQTFNVTTIDLRLNTCQYSTSENETRITYTCNTIPTILFTSLGTKRLSVFANDTVGNFNNSNYTFTILNNGLIFISPPTPNDSSGYISQNYFSVSVNISGLGSVNSTFRLYNSTFAIINETNTSRNSECYQEYANVSYPCGSLQTGSYSDNGNWNDGVWTTVESNQIHFVNYTVPNYALNTTSKLQINSFSSYVNISINSNICNYPNLQLRITSYFLDYIQCKNSTGWFNLYQLLQNRFSEEAMIWAFDNKVIYYNLSDGTYYYNVTSLDVLNNSYYSATRSVTFEYVTPQDNSYSYQYQVVTGQPNVIYSNFTLNVAPSLILLVYNGTNYVPSATQYGSNYILNATVIAPATMTNTTTSFYYLFTINGVNYTTSSNIQFVYPISLSTNCSGNYNLINISNFDEQTLNNISGTVEYVLNLQNQNNEVASIYGNATGANIQLCSVQSLASSYLNYNLQLRYYAEDYVYKTYNIQSASVSNLPLSIPLYYMPINNGTQFKLNYVDFNYLTYPGAIIQIQRQYLGENVYRTVEIPKLDNNGKTTGTFNTNNIRYKLVVMNGGTILDTFDNVFPSCQNVILGTCELDLRGAEVIPSSTTGDFTYTLVKTNTSLTLTYNIPSGTPRTIEFRTAQNSRFLQNISTCTSSVFASGGTITCGYNATIGDSIIDTEIINSDGSHLYGTVGVSEDLSSFFMLNNYFIAFILILSLALMFVSSGVVLVLISVISLVFSALIFLLRKDLLTLGGSLGWIVVAAVIIIYKISQREERT